MPNIDTYLNSIMIAELGEDVRGSIHDAIEIMNEAVDEGITEAAAMVGTPLVASTVDGMTDTTKVYVYTGDEFGYNYGYWYYYDGSTWQEGGAYNSEGGIDSINEKIGDLSELITAVKTDLVSAINEAAQSGGGGLGEEEKSLILALFSKATYADDTAGEIYEQLDNLWAIYSITWAGSGYTHNNTSSTIEGGEDFTSTVTASGGHDILEVTVTMGGDIVQGAWHNGTVSIPNVTGNIVINVTTVEATVSSLSANYTSTGKVHENDSLDSLKSNLVVIATYADQSTYVVPPTDYTLSGTLAIGTSSITVTYQEATTTFNVTVYEKTYVTDGLIMMLDGEKNGQNGEHSSSVLTWYDQAENGWDWTATTAFSAGDKYISFAGDRLSRESIPQNVAFIEIVLAFSTATSASSDYKAIVTGFGNGYAGNITSHGNNIVFHTGNGTGTSYNKKFERVQDTSPHAYNSLGYRDGVIASTVALISDEWQYTRPAIGNYRSYDDRVEYPFSGKIYSIRMYNRVLTEDEILYNFELDSERFGIDD